MIDAEKIVGDYLRAAPAVTADVVGRTPASTKSAAWIRLTLIDAPDGGDDDYFVPYLLQLDCYKGGQAEVWALAIATRAALKAMPGTQADAVVTAVRFTSTLRLPDQDFEPARERVIITANVYAHPA